MKVSQISILSTRIYFSCLYTFVTFIIVFIWPLSKFLIFYDFSSIPYHYTYLLIIFDHFLSFSCTYLLKNDNFTSFHIIFYYSKYLNCCDIILFHLILFYSNPKILVLLSWISASKNFDSKIRLTNYLNLGN